MKKRLLQVIAIGLLLVGGFTYRSYSQDSNKSPAPILKNAKIETAIFAGGCFWCVEASFEKVDGVATVESGYTGGETTFPTYKQVSSQSTGHLEAVRVSYDANLVSYNDLLEVFWRMIDPTDASGSFVDRGESYASAIFVNDEQQRSLASVSKDRLAESGRFSETIVTPIRDVGEFYVAENYHQDYYKTHPLKYKTYRYLSGRDKFIESTWGKDKHYVVQQARNVAQSSGRKSAKPSAADIKKQLTTEQFEVTQNDGTERPFRNKYWDNKSAGIYVDVVTGEPLFSSLDKFKSGTGWPSFVRPLSSNNIAEHVDRGLFTTRTEVRSRIGNSHLGHVFNDGPAPTGLRYCVNSAALRFIPAEELEEEYPEFVPLFDAELTADSQR